MDGAAYVRARLPRLESKSGRRCLEFIETPKLRSAGLRRAIVVTVDDVAAERFLLDLPHGVHVISCPLWAGVLNQCQHAIHRIITPQLGLCAPRRESDLAPIIC